MKIDMHRNYWDDFYALQKRIERGEGRENRDLYRLLNDAYERAQQKDEQVALNWSALGIKNH